MKELNTKEMRSLEGGSIAGLVKLNLKFSALAGIGKLLVKTAVFKTILKIIF